MADSITLSVPVNIITQRDVSTDDGDIAVAGTYVGTLPGTPTIEAQVVNSSDSSVVLAWQDVDLAPTGGTWSGTVASVPQGGPYNIWVRFKNETATKDEDDVDVGVGSIIAVLGQSNASLLGTRSGSDVLEDTLEVPDGMMVRFLEDDGWSDPHADDTIYNADGLLAFARRIYEKLSIPVGFMRYANGSTSLSYVVSSTPEQSAGNNTTVASDNGKGIWTENGYDSTDYTVWSGATAYVVGDLVSYSGAYFRCVYAHTNQAPSGNQDAWAYWQNVGDRTAESPLWGTGTVGSVREWLYDKFKTDVLTTQSVEPYLEGVIWYQGEGDVPQEFTKFGTAYTFGEAVSVGDKRHWYSTGDGSTRDPLTGEIGYWQCTQAHTTADDATAPDVASTTYWKKIWHVYDYIGNSSNPTSQARYKAGLDELVTNINADFTTPGGNLSVVICALARQENGDVTWSAGYDPSEDAVSDYGIDYDGITLIRSAQHQKGEESNVYTVDTYDAKMSYSTATTIHLNAQGKQVVGARLAEQHLAHLGESTYAPTTISSAKSLNTTLIEVTLSGSSYDQALGTYIHGFGVWDANGNNKVSDTRLDGNKIRLTHAVGTPPYTVRYQYGKDAPEGLLARYYEGNDNIQTVPTVDNGTIPVPLLAYDASTNSHWDVTVASADTYITHINGKSLNVHEHMQQSILNATEASLTVAQGLKLDYMMPSYSAQDYGVQADIKRITGDNATINTGVSTTTLNVDTTIFTPQDAGKEIRISGAGAAGALLATTIASVTSGVEVELTDSASTTVTDADIIFGTDDLAKLNELYDYVVERNGGIIWLGYGEIGISDTFNIRDNGVTILGAGSGRKTGDLRGSDTAFVWLGSQDGDMVKFSTDPAVKGSDVDGTVNCGLIGVGLHGDSDGVGTPRAGKGLIVCGVQKSLFQGLYLQAFRNTAIELATTVATEHTGQGGGCAANIFQAISIFNGQSSDCGNGLIIGEHNVAASYFKDNVHNNEFVDVNGWTYSSAGFVNYYSDHNYYRNTGFTVIYPNDMVLHSGTQYICRLAHTSSAGTEPGTSGGDLYWAEATYDLSPAPSAWSSGSVAYVATYGGEFRGSTNANGTYPRYEYGYMHCSPPFHVFGTDDPTVTYLKVPENIHMVGGLRGNANGTPSYGTGTNGLIQLDDDVLQASNVTYKGDFTNGSVSTTATIDWSEGRYQDVTLSAATTFTFTQGDARNTPLRGQGDFFLKVTSADTNAPTWPADVSWKSGYEPSYIDAEMILRFYYDGTTYHGSWWSEEKVPYRTGGAEQSRYLFGAAPNATGNFNFAAATGCLQLLDGGVNNFAAGYFAAGAVVDSSNIVALGANSYAGGDANAVTSIGANALRTTTTGGESVAIGTSALRENTDGTNSVAIGFATARNTGSATGQVAIGHEAGRYETDNNTLHISNNTTGSESGDEAASIIYGEMDVGTPSNQVLKLNATVYGTYGFVGSLEGTASYVTSHSQSAASGNGTVYPLFNAGAQVRRMDWSGGSVAYTYNTVSPSANRLSVPCLTVNTTDGLTVNGSSVRATGDEISKLDGCTASTANLSSTATAFASGTVQSVTQTASPTFVGLTTSGQDTFSFATSGTSVNEYCASITQTQDGTDATSHGRGKALVLTSQHTSTNGSTRGNNQLITFTSNCTASGAKTLSGNLISGQINTVVGTGTSVKNLTNISTTMGIAGTVTGYAYAVDIATPFYAGTITGDCVGLNIGDYSSPGPSVTGTSYAIKSAGGAVLLNLPSGTTQPGAVNAGELWHDTTDDTVKVGV